MTTEFWDYKDQVAYAPEKANRITLAETGHSRTSLWCLLPGQHIHPHEHAGDHIWVILEGEGRFLSSEAPRLVEPGMILLAPAGQPHGIENSGREGLVFISVSAG